MMTQEITEDTLCPRTRYRNSKRFKFWLDLCLLKYRMTGHIIDRITQLFTLEKTRYDSFVWGDCILLFFSFIFQYYIYGHDQDWNTIEQNIKGDLGKEGESESRIMAHCAPPTHPRTTYPIDMSQESLDLFLHCI